VSDAWPQGLAARLQRAAHELGGAHAAVTGRSVEFTHQPLGRHIDPGGLRGYYCDLRHKALHTIDGMPRSRAGMPDPQPIPVAQTALGFWELMIEGLETRNSFLKLADWLVDNGAAAPYGGVVWRTQMSLPKYRVESGWASAMAQGQAASVLLRAQSLTGRQAYGRTAHAVVKPLMVDVAEGGLQRTVNGSIVLEEYPSALPCAILNGWIFALLGLYELSVAGGSDEARELFERSAAGLVALLPRYDIGWWSLYSLYDHGRPDLAKPFYHRLHPVLLEALALVYPHPSLNFYADRWNSQLTRFGTARASLDKLYFRAYRAFAERNAGAGSPVASER
jgi:hypothetical protein